MKYKNIKVITECTISEMKPNLDMYNKLIVHTAKFDQTQVVDEFDINNEITPSIITHKLDVISLVGGDIAVMDTCPDICRLVKYVKYLEDKSMAERDNTFKYEYEKAVYKDNYLKEKKKKEALAAITIIIFITNIFFLLIISGVIK